MDTKTTQQGLIVTAPNEPAIAVDDLDVAQFVYFLLYSRAVRFCYRHSNIEAGSHLGPLY